MIGGQPGQLLFEFAFKALFLVIGSPGRGPMAGMVPGSLSSAVIHGASDPVLVCTSRHQPMTSGMRATRASALLTDPWTIRARARRRCVPTTII